MDGDVPAGKTYWPPKYFNPRRPYGRRLKLNQRAERDGIFQSTPPIWTATGEEVSQSLRVKDFNPRRPYGRRPLPGCIPGHGSGISIHAAHMDGDQPQLLNLLLNANFNPRRPYGRRLHSSRLIVTSHSISIHAAHMDGDIIFVYFNFCIVYFNPRRPYGRRLR